MQNISGFPVPILFHVFNRPETTRKVEENNKDNI